MGIMDNIRSMRENAKASEIKFYTSKFSKNLSPGDFKEGKTIIRIAPSNDPDKYPPFVPFRSTYLEVEMSIDQLTRFYMEKTITDKKLLKEFGVDKIEDLTQDKFDDDKLRSMLVKLLGDNFTMKANKRLFISTLHGKEGSKDLIEEYIKFLVNRLSSEVPDKDERKKLLAPVYGYKDRNNKWNPGIVPTTNYVCYGWDWSDSSKPLYKIELYKTMMDRIEELYIKFDQGGEPLVIDPFSSPEEGIGIEFDRYKDEDGKFKFRIEDVMFNPRKFKSYSDFQAQFILDKQQLDQLKEVKSLQELFGRGCFKSSDFKLQLNGMIMFDEKNGYGLFSDEEFLTVVEDIAACYSEDEDSKTNENTDDVIEESNDNQAEETNDNKENIPEEQETPKTDIEKILSKKPLMVKKSEVKNSILPPKTKTTVIENKDSVTEEGLKNTPTIKGSSLQEKLAALKKAKK